MSVLGGLAFGLGAAGGSALFGSIFGGDDDAKDRANRANEARFGRALGEAESAQGFTNLAASKINKIFGKLPGIVTAGFDEARNELEGVGDAARTGIQEREEQSRARQTQSASNRGFSNSASVLGSIERSTRFESNRALRDLDEQISLLRTGLSERRGLGIAQAFQAQAQGLMSSTQMRRQASQTIIDLLASVTDRATPSGESGLFGQLLGSLAGSLVGGGFGGGGGGADFNAEGLTVPAEGF